MFKCKNLILGIFAMFGLAAGALSQTGAPVSITKAEKKTVAEFEKRVQKYSKLRQSALDRVTKPGTDATPEQITAYKSALRSVVQNMRANAVAGEMFTPETQAIIKKLIKAEFKGWELSELRKKVIEADTKGVPLKVNFPYPEQKELIDMPPPLLLALPQLTPNLRYRFIGRSLAILDRDNALILDFMREALP